jgi:hypothetical protein
MESNYRDMKITNRFLLVIAIAAALTTGCRSRPKSDPARVPVASAVGGGAVRGSADAAAVRSAVTPGMTVVTPPPMPLTQPQENIPARPSRDAIWIAGYYNFTGTGYAWKPGRWEVPPAGLTAWVPPSWQPSGNEYVYLPGRWQ